MIFGRRPCEKNRERLSAYFDGRLRPEEARELEAHLGSCQACSEEKRTLQLTVEAVRRLPRVPLPRSFVLQAPPIRAGQPSFWYYALRNATGAVAAVLVFVIAFTYFLPGWDSGSGVSDFGRTAPAAAPSGRQAGGGEARPADSRSGAATPAKVGAPAPGAPAQGAPAAGAPRAAAPTKEAPAPLSVPAPAGAAPAPTAAEAAASQAPLAETTTPTGALAEKTATAEPTAARTPTGAPMASAGATPTPPAREAARAAGDEEPEILPAIEMVLALLFVVLLGATIILRTRYQRR